MSAQAGVPDAVVSTRAPGEVEGIARRARARHPARCRCRYNRERGRDAASRECRRSDPGQMPVAKTLVCWGNVSRIRL